MSRSSASILFILLIAVSATSGCRSFQGNFLRREVAQAPPQPDRPDPAELVRRVALEHDRRAALVQSLKVSDLKIVVDSYTDQDGRSRSTLLGGFLGGTAEGVMVMERPRNLRILLRKPLGVEVADIGSNDREFWFANDMAHEMVVGNYAQAEGFSDPFLASVRPDWIFEVLGLEPISEDASIKPGNSDAILTIVENRTLPSGVRLVKESDISVPEQRIIEHRLYSEGRRELLAGARVEQPVSLTLGPEDGTESPPTIQLPRFVRLTIPDVAELKMSLVGLQPNPTDDFATMASFERPEKQGYQLVDLFELADQSGSALASVPPILPPSVGDSPSAAPGALVLPPLSDGAVSRTEDVSSGPLRLSSSSRARSSSSGPVAPDLPSASQIPSPDIRRETWSTVEGNRFRRGVLGRE